MEVMMRNRSSREPKMLPESSTDKRANRVLRPDTNRRKLSYVPQESPSVIMIIHPPLKAKKPDIESNIERKFRSLATQWSRDTEHLSSVKKAIMNRSYQRILTLGEKAIPCILREMEHNPDHWFYALEIISDENPVSPEDDFDGAVAAWLSWGKVKGYI